MDKLDFTATMEKIGRVTGRRVMQTGFEYPVFASPQRLRVTAQSIASSLIDLFGHEVPLQLVCRGTSGLLIAYEIERQFDTIQRPVSIFYCRKDNETSHGGASNLSKTAKLIVVDDHIDTGNTMKAIATYIDKRARPYEPRPCERVECVAAIGAEVWGNRMLLDLFPNLKYVLY